MDSREAWQLDGEGLKSEVLDLVRVRHELQSRMVLLIVEMFSREVLGGKGFRAIAQWLHGSTNLEIGECSLLVGLAEFYASKGLYGRVTVKGDLDAVNGARLITLLSSLSAPTPEKDGVKDTRTPALRRADGFCELLRRYERAGLGPIEGGVKPHITVTASAKDMTDLQALKDLLPSTEELGFAWTDWVGPISIDTARMLACDCTVTRILLDENGVPLDCGKEARTATVPQRRALAVRDGGCAFPGCGTPSGWCDAHHIVHWNDGGPTDLDNLILLCGHHHRTMHHTEWRVEIGPDRKTVFYPPMSIDPYQQPIGGNSPPTAA